MDDNGIENNMNTLCLQPNDILRPQNGNDVQG